MAIFRIGTTFLALCYSTYLVLAIPLDGCINHAFDSENVTGRSMLVAASAVYTNDTGAFTLSTATAGSRGSTTAATFSPSPPVPTSSPAEFMLEQSATGALGQVADDSTSTVFVLSSTAAVAGVMAVPSMSATPHDTCEGSDNACSGDVTHWDGGCSACGWTIDPEIDKQIALPVAFMGAASNTGSECNAGVSISSGSNPYCGRNVTIQNPATGTTVRAVVGDKCGGCEGHSIDLTNVLFRAVVPDGDGREHGIQWWLE